MSRRFALAVAVCLIVGLLQGSAAAGRQFTPGAPGVGDPYYPYDGNGGYDVQHYTLDISYSPPESLLIGRAVISATATQGLSRFDLDLRGLRVRSVTVDGTAATWTRRRDHELIITPAQGIPDGASFVTVVRYDGVPRTLGDGSGFIYTDDGALVMGEPHGAATWFPCNDHPSDKASYTFHITAPSDLQVIANGDLAGTEPNGTTTTWRYEESAPMASYLATMGIGHYDERTYTKDGIRYRDGLDPVLFHTIAPRTGDQYALSQMANLSYKRLTHTVTVPAGGAQLSFWVNRDTEPSWDFFFVEAHTLGQDDWTTLPDQNGHTTQDTGNSCPFWLGIHPFLEHYQSEGPNPGEPPCEPTGTTGEWWAATGPSSDYEDWSVDLSPWAGSTVEVSLTVASDDIVQHIGAFVDDVVVSTGEGTTSFEDDGNVMDGWTVPGPPPGSPGNDNDWIAGTAADAPPSAGENAKGSLGHEGQYIAFMEQAFGPYPFDASGGIVDDVGVGFALENQTRPTYSPAFFDTPGAGDSTVVHELAHMWFGDSLSVRDWSDIWLNEGFATYAEWLWSTHAGTGTPKETFAFLFGAIPADDPFWQVVIGDPGTSYLFDGAIYLRGAMTLQVLRMTVGDDAFFQILKEWAATYAGGNVTTDQFIALSEQVSGIQLDDLFQTWLFTPEKPPWKGGALASGAAVPGAVRSALARMRIMGQASPLSS